MIRIFVTPFFNQSVSPYNFNNNTFIEKATGNYSLEEFVDAFNNERLSCTTDVARIIEVGDIAEEEQTPYETGFNDEPKDNLKEALDNFEFYLHQLQEVISDDLNDSLGETKIQEWIDNSRSELQLELDEEEDQPDVPETTALIAWERPDMSTIVIKLNSNGHPDKAGQLLKKHYQTRDLVERLLNVSDITTLKERVDTTEYVYPYVDAHFVPAVDDVLRMADREGCGYAYVWVERSNVWLDYIL